MPKILIASPVRQQFEILRHFLLSLSELFKINCECHYIFIDDCNAEDSLQLLCDFERINKNVTVISSNIIIKENSLYFLHGWDDSLIQRVASLKNYHCCPR